MTTAQKQKRPSILVILVPIFLILLVIVGSLFFIKYRLVDTSKAPQVSQIGVGKILPDFALTDMSGKKTTISRIEGKVILINFWATWCESCLQEMPSIVQLRENFHSKGLEIIGINLDENPAAVVPRAVKQYQMGFPVFQDPNGKIAELFDVYAIPLTVIMNKKREIIYLQNGEKDWHSKAVQTQIGKWLSE
jgi:peroxiredoxin